MKMIVTYHLVIMPLVSPENKTSLTTRSCVISSTTVCKITSLLSFFNGEGKKRVEPSRLLENNWFFDVHASASIWSLWTLISRKNFKSGPQIWWINGLEIFYYYFFVTFLDTWIQFEKFCIGFVFEWTKNTRILNKNFKSTYFNDSISTTTVNMVIMEQQTGHITGMLMFSLTFMQNRANHFHYTFSLFSTKKNNYHVPFRLLSFY